MSLVMCVLAMPAAWLVCNIVIKFLHFLFGGDTFGNWLDL